MHGNGHQYYKPHLQVLDKFVARNGDIQELVSTGKYHFALTVKNIALF